MTENPIRIFFSYSHRDEEFKDELVKHLSLLRRQGVISEWHDRMIIAGSEWDREIDKYLSTADIILLMVSPDFLASDYCWGVEVQKAMQRHEAGEACVIPVVLRWVIWKGAPFAKLQALPKNAEPVASSFWSSRDEAFYDVSQGITSAVESLRQAQIQRQKAEQLPAEQARLEAERQRQQEEKRLAGLQRQAEEQARLKAEEQKRQELQRQAEERQAEERARSKAAERERQEAKQQAEARARREAAEREQQAKLERQAKSKVNSEAAGSDLKNSKDLFLKIIASTVVALVSIALVSIYFFQINLNQNLIMALVGVVPSITSLVCLILVLMKLFPDKGVGWGIFGIICGIYTFIWGWQNVELYNLKNIMIIWSAAIAANILIRILAISASGQ